MALVDKAGQERQFSVIRTTLRITNDTYRRAKAKSSELGVSLTRFFEEGFRRFPNLKVLLLPE